MFLGYLAFSLWGLGLVLLHHPLPQPEALPSFPLGVSMELAGIVT